MRFLAAIVDALVAFVRRNPLLVLCVVVLAFAAPTLLRRIAAFVLYALFGLLLFLGVFALLFRLRIRRLEREFGRDASDGDSRARTRRKEGDVRVYRTPATPEKRISSDVGDYVDFEETKDE